MYHSMWRRTTMNARQMYSHYDAKLHAVYAQSMSAAFCAHCLMFMAKETKDVVLQLVCGRSGSLGTLVYLRSLPGSAPQ
jgi:hypothetical protein